MGHPRRKFEHGKMYIITNRFASGLPLVPNSYITSLIEGAAARAINRNPGIAVCALEWLQNHYHGLIIVTGDPADVSGFLHDLDDEIAKIVCRLLGKRNIKVWAQRAHAASIGDYGAAVKEMAYAYLNAVAANFCAKASQWIGAGTFRFLFDRTPLKCKWVRTRSLEPLPKRPFTKKQIAILCAGLKEAPGEEYELRVDPCAWKTCFEQTAGLSDEEVRELILEEVTAGEKAHHQRRRQEKTRLADPEQLMLQNPHKYYRPENFGRRCYCICTVPELRRQIIAAYRSFCEECREVWEAWKRGDLSRSYPPGAYLPPRLPLANVLSSSP